MSAARHERFRGDVVLLLALATAANGLGQGLSRFTYALLLPDMRDNVIGSYSVAGLLGTLNLAAYLVGVLLVSMLTGRVSVVRIVCVGLGLCATADVVLALAPTVAVLALGMVLLGAGAAGTWVPLAAVVSGSVDPRRRGAALGAMTTGFGASILLTAQLRSLVYSLAGGNAWREVWAVEAVLVAAACAACALWLRPAPAATAARVASPAALLRSVPGWGRLTIAYVAVAVGYIIYASFLSALLQKEAHFSADHASAVFSVIGVTSILGSIVTGRIADRAGWPDTYAIACAVMATCVVLVLLRSEPWVALSAALYGLPLTTTGGLVVGYLSDHLHGSAVAAAFGAITLPFGVAQAAAPWVGGWVRDETGSFTATFVLAAVALAIASISAALLPRGGPGVAAARAAETASESA
jgi:predicted MFS family arabinose efflux permease